VGGPIISQEKGAQNSRNNEARLPKLENQRAKSYFEIGIEKSTPPMATVPSQIGPARWACRQGDTYKPYEHQGFPAKSAILRGVGWGWGSNHFARKRRPELEKWRS